MKMTKEAVLENLEEIKKFISEVEQEKKEEKVVGIAIKNRITGSIIFQSTKTTYKEAVQERLASGANLRDANLRDANLRDANLLGADLSGADLSGADLSDADLSDADLSDANLSGADLSDADLRGADLRGADLRGANFRGANLSDANLRGANFRGADLSGAELNRALFYGRGGTNELTKAQLPAFLGALGFIIVD